MNPNRRAFVERLSGWLRSRLSDEMAEACEPPTLDGLYTGKSKRIHRLIRIAYHRGVRRGVGIVWEAQQPITFRSADTEGGG